MSLIVNNQEIGSSIKLNNTDLSEIIFNGVSVWSAEPTIYKLLKNATDPITESQWLQFINENCIALAIEKGEQSQFIGKKITINNTYNSYTQTYNTWTIADFNHDNTNNTVDLIASQIVYAWQFNSSGKYYGTSNIRSFLINSYLPAFSTDIKSKLVQMTVKTIGGGTTDKIKILSTKELGIGSANEGNTYPIFTDNNSRKRDGYWFGYWTRTYNNNDVYYINSYGYTSTATYDSAYGVLPCIRFSN